MNVETARLIGHAGSGKTTELMKIMEAALPRLGNDPTRLGFASFTRAARAEAVSRASDAWGVHPGLLDNEGWFRTVHSTAKRCLQVSSGQLLGGTKADTEWISNALGVKVSTSIDEDTGQQRYVGGDEGASLTCWEYARATLQPLEEVVRSLRSRDPDVPVYAKVVRVAERYEMQKRVEDRLDFTDLLMRFSGYRASPTDGSYKVEPEGELPGVSAWLFDEQQDASPLLDAACKRLISAPSVRWCYVVGDPFQSIYGFAGSTSECFLGWKVKKERIMPKSYRCPRPILELGERCLRRMHEGYFDRGVEPADHEGEVCERELDDVVAMAKPGEEWLFISRNNYDAARMYAALRSAGVPARWVKQQDATTARGEGLEALYALETGAPISGKQWERAMGLLPSKTKDGAAMLTRGTKANWSKHADSWDVIFPNELEKVGATAPLIEQIRTGKWCGLVDDGEIWRRHAVKWGVELASQSRIRVGTIHSVKGAEADNVALLTTISKKTQHGMADRQQYDEECRIAYVGVTRARRRLIVMGEGKRGRQVPSMEVI